MIEKPCIIRWKKKTEFQEEAIEFQWVLIPKVQINQKIKVLVQLYEDK